MTLEQDIGRLARTRPFDLLPRDALKLIAFSAERKSFLAGDGIFEQGQEADCGYFILSGAILLTIYGKGEPQERVFGAGALIGEMAMIAPAHRPASARAAENTITLRIGREILARVLSEFPREAARIRAALAARTKDLAAELDDLRKRALI